MPGYTRVNIKTYLLGYYSSTGTRTRVHSSTHVYTSYCNTSVLHVYTCTRVLHVYVLEYQYCNIAAYYVLERTGLATGMAMATAIQYIHGYGHTMAYRYCNS